MMPSNPRNKNGAARRSVSMRLRSEGRPCWICVAAGKTVSKYWLGGYPTAQAAALDYKNLAAAHKCCNEWRGNKTVEEVMRIVSGRKGGRKPPTAKAVRTSRDWTSGTRRSD